MVLFTIASLVLALSLAVTPGKARAAAGDLDPAYGIGGVAENGAIDPLSPREFPADVAPVGLQPSGSAIVAGYVSEVTCSPSCLYDSYYAIRRLDRDGTADISFGDNGVVRADFGLEPDVRFEQTLVQPDGSILILGQTRTPSPSAMVIRLTADGSLDGSFGGDGIAELTFPDTSDLYGLGLALQSDGGIIVGVGADGGDYKHSIREVARLNFNGSQDLGYGTAGFQVDRPQKGDFLGAVLVDSHDRTILVHGSLILFHRAFLHFSRYLPNGSPDSAFGGDGKVAVRKIRIGSVQAVVTNTDAILVLDTARPASLTKVTSTGEHDPSFGERGVAQIRPRGAPRSRRQRIQLNGLALQPDGKVLVTGGRTLLGGSLLTVGRLMPGGSPDRSFAGDGFANVFIDPALNQALPLALPGDGLLVAGGGPDASIVSARFKTALGPPADADADGVGDTEDRCPLRSGSRRGCPRFRRLALTLEVRPGNFLRITLNTPAAQCAARARVRIMNRVVGAPDRRLNSSVLSRGSFDDGEAVFDTHVSPSVSGLVYASVDRSLDPRSGICTGVRSKAVRPTDHSMGTGARSGLDDVAGRPPTRLDASTDSHP